MGCTRRYRVTVPSPAVQEEDGERKWALPETEKEWQEWQKQWEGEFKVKRYGKPAWRTVKKFP
jgi:hypothetical protein